jgi:hypothetical protein
MDASTVRRAALVLLAGLWVAPLHAQEQSTLTVRKAAGPGAGGLTFSFTLEGGGGDQAFELRRDEHETFLVDPGSYVIREQLVEDWDLALIRCGTLYYDVGPVASGALEVELGPGQSLSCEFFNHNPEIPPPHPPEPPIEAPMLSPTALSVLLMALAIAGGFLLRKVI